MKHKCKATKYTCKHQRQAQRETMHKCIAAVVSLSMICALVFWLSSKVYGDEKIRPYLSSAPVAGESAQFKDLLIPHAILYVSPEGQPPSPTPTGTPWTVQGNKDIQEIIASDKGWMKNIVTNAAARYGVSQTLFHAIAVCESGYQPAVKAKTSSATGIFQFIKGTWMGYVKKRGLDWTLEDRKDPEKNADMAAYVIARGGLHNWEADPRSEACWGWARNL